ncbi:MAG: hypothetical protein U0W24_02995 [Bacteroidales bacterium]
MACHPSYTCNECGYSVIESNGFTNGTDTPTETYICTRCEIIIDIVPLKNENSDRRTLNKCPQCGMAIFKKWDEEIKPCPKCNGTMKPVKSPGCSSWD